MKKLLSIFVLLAGFAISANALEYEPESGLSFQGLFGLNMSNFRGTYIDSKVKPSFNVGVRGEYMLPNCKGVFVNLGANFSMKGAKADIVGGLADGTLKARAGYIEIPLHVGYRYNFSDLLGVYADFGPYIALGICGKSIQDFTDDTIDDISMRFFRKTNGTFGDIQRFDTGLGCRVGAEYDNHHSLTFGFDWGLTDMYTDKFRKSYSLANPIPLDKMKNFNASITYGYRF